MGVDKKDLLARYEARGDEPDFLEALPLYEQAAANGASPEDLVGYGYLLEVPWPTGAWPSASTARTTSALNT